MAGKLVNAISATITSSTAAGYVNVASTTGFYVGGRGAMTKAATPNVQIVITEIVSATQMGVRIVPETILDNPGAGAPNYGRSDASAYSGGTGLIFMHAQLIYNNNDLPLT